MPRRCSSCGRTPDDTSFYPDRRVVSDGLRARCRECLTNGRPPGPTPRSPLDRITPGHGGCWIWTGAVGSRSGYGAIKVEGRTIPAHRVVYALIVGVIPAGLVLDHLCRVKRCVRPEHLEPVTHAENIRRHWQYVRAAA